MCDDFVARVHEHNIVHRVVDEDPGGGLHADVVVAGGLHDDDDDVVVVVIFDVVDSLIDMVLCVDDVDGRSLKNV